MDVFLLWHVHHSGAHEGASTPHRAREDELSWDEMAGDDLKLLGVYSTDDRARNRIASARELPGFREEPDCFLVDRYPGREPVERRVCRHRVRRKLRPDRRTSCVWASL
jgi:hypothetical protein